MVSLRHIAIARKRIRSTRPPALQATRHHPRCLDHSRGVLVLYHQLFQPSSSAAANMAHSCASLTPLLFATSPRSSTPASLSGYDHRFGASFRDTVHIPILSVLLRRPSRARVEYQQFDSASVSISLDILMHGRG